MSNHFKKEQNILSKIFNNKIQQFDESESLSKMKKKKKKEEKCKIEKYQCGNNTCNKIYHSYTAFYNHCKKSHNGQFPQNSLMNQRLFTGPSKNRGRPRITKIDVKNPLQIQAMKSQNQLIQFLGTINIDRVHNRQDVIVSVQDAVEQINKSLDLAFSWGLKDQSWIQKIRKYNQSISGFDLPQFYDPLYYHKFIDQVDTYNFVSIVKFLENSQNRIKCDIERIDSSTIKIVAIIWLARIVSTNLLAQIIYILGQDQEGNQIIQQKDLFEAKSARFLQVIGKFFGCYNKQNSKEKNSGKKKSLGKDNNLRNEQDDDDEYSDEDYENKEGKYQYLDKSRRNNHQNDKI